MKIVFLQAEWQQRVRDTFRLLAATVFLVLLPFLVQSQDHPDRAGEPFRVMVFTPTTVGNTYWPEVHGVMRAAAASLQLEIFFHEFDARNRFAKAEEGVRILRTEPVPDAAIFSVAFGQSEPLMDVAEQLGIPFFLNGPLFPEELAMLGDFPRRRYHSWIGYFNEDEEEKGYLLARELIAAARAHGRVASDGTVKVVGVGGDATWYGSALREAGLRRAVAEDPAAQLLQTVPTRWTPEEGRTMTTRLLARYPEVTVVWAASDQLATGAAEGLRSLGMEPGEAAFTGGLDLSLVGLEAVREGNLTATVASSALIWAEILVCLHDYLHDVDHADRPGVEISFPPKIATYATAKDYIRQRSLDEATDYTKFVPCQRREAPVQNRLPEENQ